MNESGRVLMVGDHPTFRRGLGAQPRTLPPLAPLGHGGRTPRRE